MLCSYCVNMNLLTRRGLLFVLAVASFSFVFVKEIHASSFDKQSSVSTKYETQDWSFEQRGPILAIGDVHADPYSLIDILIRAGVINSKGLFVAHERGKFSHIVFLGDYADKGPYTRGVWDLLLFLEKETSKHGIDLILHVGNHDKMIQLENFTRMEEADLVYFSENSFGAETAEIGVSRTVLQSPYKKLMERMRLMTRIGRYFFVHAGFGDPDYFMDFMDRNGIGEFNRVYTQFVVDQHENLRSKLEGVRRDVTEVHPLLEYWDFKSPQGPSGLPNTPLWSRDLMNGKFDSDKLTEIMERLEVDLIVHGHTVTKSREPSFNFGGATLDLDTNISGSYLRKDSRASLSAAILDETGGVEILSSAKDSGFKRGLNSEAYHWFRTRLSPSSKHCEVQFLYSNN